MTHGAALIALLLVAELPARAAPRGPAERPALVDVPYVSQDERLCGGAAAAMLMRAAGARGIYADDFAPLIDEAAGGIHTMDLAAALRARGYRITVSNGTSETLREQLARGRPALVLVEDRPGRYHYVVVVGWTARAVIFHDPARAPFVERTSAQFDAAWRASERWMLTIDARPATDDSLASATPREADRIPSPNRDLATRRFIDHDYVGAARLAAHAVDADPGDHLAWRLLGASRYLAGDPGGALDAWNRAGDPRLDLIQIEGLNRTPHRVVERLVGLLPGKTLTRSALARAERRLALLPAGRTSRVTYVALPHQLAEVRGAIVERPLVPSRADWMVTAARVPIDRELSIAIANAGSAGDRLSAAWRFWDGRPRVAVEYQFPSRLTGGVWALSSSWQQEHYRDAAPADVRDLRIGWTNWAGARLRIGGGAGIARWIGRGGSPLFDGTLEYRPLNEMTSFEVTMTGATGSAEPFTTTGMAARWRVAPGALRIFGSTTVWRVSSGAPPDRWPGAGVGRARPLLLRAHPLLGGGGRIEGPVFGRTAAQTTVEAERDVARRGLATFGVAAFADAARAWRRADGTSSPLHIDVGIGLRLRLAPGSPALRFDLARGVRDGHLAFSAGWQTRWWTRGAR